MTRRKPYNIIALTSTLLLCQFLFNNPAMAQNNASFSKIKGAVKVFKMGKAQGAIGKLGMPLFAGDIIATAGKDSLADITFPMGDIVRIMPNSRLEIKGSDFIEKRSLVSLKLLSGKIFNVIHKFTRPSKYEIETRFAVAGVRGTIWSAEIAKNKKDVFMVKNGVVGVFNPQVSPKKETLVKAFKKTIVEEDSLPVEPIPLTLEETTMFDILDNILERIKENIKNEIKQSIAEDMMN